MKFQTQKNNTKLVLVITSFLVVSFILWNTNVFFKKFKEEERYKMEIWATAQAEFIQTTDLERDLGDLPITVLENNTTTPMILVSKDGKIQINNLPSEKLNDSVFIKKRIDKFSLENDPIEISYRSEKLATLYYGNSEVLNKLKYYPIALLLIIFLFGAVIFFFFRTNKISEQNKLWAGMAKETAHQIGTPLSSLLGWNELLRTENVSSSITKEIDKDISRLQTITDRFSKIGSLPKLEPLDIVAETTSAFNYLKSRSSKSVDFLLEAPQNTVMVDLNSSLYNWTIENLVKNGIDAMKGRGDIAISIKDDNDLVHILVSDTGKGIPKKDQHQIFNPGFTTKKRGWGLGLSLVKRIVEDYHNGKIKVLSSQKDSGTTMQMTFKKQS